jgi:DNA modification methylase
MKPVELVERALINSSKAGDIVADLFGGAGSTLIGCERTGRRARLMEIDAKYVDVIVARWQSLTNKEAILANGGATFEQTKCGRRLRGENTISEHCEQLVTERDK